MEKLLYVLFYYLYLSFQSLFKNRFTDLQVALLVITNYYDSNYIRI